MLLLVSLQLLDYRLSNKKIKNQEPNTTTPNNTLLFGSFVVVTDDDDDDDENAEFKSINPLHC